MDTVRIIKAQFGRVLCAVMLMLSLPAHSIERITYYHNDPLGSPVAATDTQGNVVWRESYQPYGSRTQHQGDSQNKVWFTGKQEDSLMGVSYFGARWYDPEMGRFLAMDPVGVSISNPHSFNRYAYANNNPYRFVDPDGKLGLLINAFRQDMPLEEAMEISHAGNASTGGYALAEYANNVADGKYLNENLTHLNSLLLRKDPEAIDELRNL